MTETTVPRRTWHGAPLPEDWLARFALAALPKALLVALVLTPVALTDDPTEAVIPYACVAVQRDNPDRVAVTRLAEATHVTKSQARAALYLAAEGDACP